MVVKQFTGFKNKEQLKKHLAREFPKSKVVRIGKKRILKGVTKSTAPTTQFSVSLKKRK